jgi:hypothetical protein
MACYQTGTVISLATRETVSLPDVRGATLRVAQGTLWLTEARDAQDIVLRPGDNWVVEHDGATVVEARNDAVFCIVGRRGIPLALPGRAKTRGGIVASLASWFSVAPRQIPYV